MHLLLTSIFLSLLLSSCRERAFSQIETSAVAAPRHLGTVNRRLEKLQVKAISITSDKPSSFAKHFVVRATFVAECAEKMPKAADDLVFTDKLGPLLSATVDHRIIDVFLNRSLNESFSCRPGGTKVEWEADFPAFSSSPTRKTMVEVNGITGQE